MTYRQIGQRMGISSARVQQIEQAALNKIRVQLFSGSADQLTAQQLEWLSEISAGRNPRVRLKTTRWRGVCWSLRILKLVDRTGTKLTDAGRSLIEPGLFAKGGK